MDLVSIIMPYYKKKKYIKIAINSVIRQTYKNFELIIIYDDGSKEDLNFLKKIVKKDKRIKLFVNKKNLGAGRSRNKGIKLSKGNFIAFLDSDDLWKKNKLKKQIIFMKKNGIDASHTSYNMVIISGLAYAVPTSAASATSPHVRPRAYSKGDF